MDIGKLQARMTNFENRLLHDRTLSAESRLSMKRSISQITRRLREADAPINGRIDSRNKAALRIQALQSALDQAKSERDAARQELLSLKHTIKEFLA